MLDNFVKTLYLIEPERLINLGYANFLKISINAIIPWNNICILEISSEMTLKINSEMISEVISEMIPKMIFEMMWNWWKCDEQMCL